MAIVPDEERQNNWTKVLRDTLVSFVTSCQRGPLSVSLPTEGTMEEIGTRKPGADCFLLTMHDY